MVGGLGVEGAPVGVKAANARVERRRPSVRAARVVPQVDPGERVICRMFVLDCGLRLRLERRALHGEALDAGRWTRLLLDQRNTLLLSKRRQDNCSKCKLKCNRK